MIFPLFENKHIHKTPGNGRKNEFLNTSVKDFYHFFKPVFALTLQIVIEVEKELFYFIIHSVNKHFYMRIMEVFRRL
jgi:hypothetical protein